MIKTKFLYVLSIILFTFNANAAFELKVNNIVINIIKNFVLIIFYNFYVFKFKYTYIII